MAFTAIYEGEERGAWQIPQKTDAYCKECGEVMRVRSEGSDGTARHLLHKANLGGGPGGGDSGTDCGGGESDEHIKWKNFAAERLGEVFDNAAEVRVEKPLAAPKTDKSERSADAAVMFEDFDEQLGHGLAVEVQHKNKDKDIEGTNRDYIAQDVAVVWLTGDDFHSKGCRLTEADFRKKAAEPADISMFKPIRAPEPTDFELEMKTIQAVRESYNTEECDYELEPRQYSVPARLPREWYDEQSLSIWRDQDWHSLFRCENVFGHYKSEQCLSAVQSSLNDLEKLRITLPPDAVDWLAQTLWDEQYWSTLFSRPESRKYIYEVRNSLSSPTMRIDFTDVIPETYMENKVKASEEAANGSYYCLCPGCHKTVGPYSPAMIRGSHQCDCGTTFKIDVEAQEAGEVIG